MQEIKGGAVGITKNLAAFWDREVERIGLKAFQHYQKWIITGGGRDVAQNQGRHGMIQDFRRFLGFTCGHSGAPQLRLCIRFFFLFT